MIETKHAAPMVAARCIVAEDAGAAVVDLITAEHQYQAARAELARLAGARDRVIVAAVRAAGDVATVVRAAPCTMTGRTVRRALCRVAADVDWTQLDLLAELDKPAQDEEH